MGYSRTLLWRECRRTGFSAPTAPLCPIGGLPAILFNLSRGDAHDVDSIAYYVGRALFAFGASGHSDRPFLAGGLCPRQV
jgi:hypothetical protein